MPRTRSGSVLESGNKRAKTGIQVGDTIPNVTLADSTGKEHPVGEIKGTLVLFSYPKASTPGCTTQTKGFGELYEQFNKLNATVFGLSADSEKAQNTFKTKLELGFELLSDPKYELLEPLGGKKSPKGVIRSHWVFKDGVCTFVEHSVKPKESPSAALEAAKEAIGEKDEPQDEAKEDNQVNENEATVSAEPEAPKADEPTEKESEKPAENKTEEPSENHGLGQEAAKAIAKSLGKDLDDDVEVKNVEVKPAASESSEANGSSDKKPEENGESSVLQEKAEAKPEVPSELTGEATTEAKPDGEPKINE